MKLSLLDQLHFGPGGSIAGTIADTMALSQHLEALDFARHWIVEHHATPYEACVDPIPMALALAGRTRRMRIGVGGVLLNNYSPYKIAESTKTLAALAPGRIDIGIGQSVSGLADLALRTDRDQVPHHDQDAKIRELLGYYHDDLPPDHPFATLKVLPGVPAPLPWIMAVGETSAVRAGRLGLPLALSAFHRPEEAAASAAAYRRAFHPSEREGLPERPSLFLTIRLSSAPDQRRAEELAMPMRWAFDQRRRLKQMPSRLPSVSEAIAAAGGVWPAEGTDWPMYVICPLPELRNRLLTMADAVGCDEIMLQDVLPDPDLRAEHYTAVAAALCAG